MNDDDGMMTSAVGPLTSLMVGGRRYSVGERGPHRLLEGLHRGGHPGPGAGETDVRNDASIPYKSTNSTNYNGRTDVERCTGGDANVKQRIQSVQMKG